MKCISCDYYKAAYMWNGCALTESECFKTIDDCTLVNDDGTVNYEDPYFHDLVNLIADPWDEQHSAESAHDSGRERET